MNILLKTDDASIRICEWTSKVSSSTVIYGCAWDESMHPRICWEPGALIAYAIETSCVFVRQAAVGLILPCGKNANAGDWFGTPELLRMRAGSCAGRVQEIVIEVLY